MAKNAAQLVARIGEVSTAVARGKSTSVMDTALFAKDEMDAGLRRVGVQPGKRSSKTGLRLPRASFNIRGFHNPTALVRYLGPAHWWESGVQPHAIAPKSWGSTRRARSQAAFGGYPMTPKGRPRAVVTPYGPKAYVRRGGGMPARRFWTPTKLVIVKGAPLVLRSGLRRNIAMTAFGK